MKSFLTAYWIPLLIISLISYLIGGINSSLVATKILKIDKDIRNFGSGNAGFTNALRTAGKKVAILTFIGDFTKGVIAVWIAIKIASIFCLENNSLEVLKVFSYTGALMCVLGHIFPCFFRFKGGKGILTAWACGLLIDWKTFLILISIFLIIFGVSRVVSLASISVAVLYPIITFIVCYMSNSKETLISTVFTTIIGIIVVFKHGSNIRRIINGTERKISINKDGVI